MAQTLRKIWIDCPACDDSGPICPACDGDGIVDCWEAIPPATPQRYTFADWLQHHHAPLRRMSAADRREDRIDQLHQWQRD